ncbi:MAG: hypothetical protein ACI9VM_000130 [Candidatus Azotimanducaceae bacterium]|jgi:hypothetical protein
MLEQRRAQENGYITLREAAEISNYAPDYIGQLIRGGKIKGEQVYNNVAWVTTEDEIQAYLADKSRIVEQSDEFQKVEALGGRVFSYVLYLVIALLVLAILVMQYIFYVSFDDSIGNKLISADSAEEKT